MTASRVDLLVLLAACGADREPAAAPPTPPPPATAATRLAATFSPELVGAITPVDATAGDYATSLDLTFDAYPTMELHISEHRTGVWRLALAADGTVTGCMAWRRNRVTRGQYHYEKDPKKRGHSETEELRLLARAGTWKVTDGVATITFDRAQWNTCDLAKASPTQPVELRCIGIQPPAHVDGKRLACEGEAVALEPLGLPLTIAAHVPNTSPMREAARGGNVIFGAPGLAVEVEQDSHAPRPAYRFVPRAIDLVEANYRPKPR